MHSDADAFFESVRLKKVTDEQLSQYAQHAADDCMAKMNEAHAMFVKSVDPDVMKRWKSEGRQFPDRKSLATAVQNQVILKQLRKAREYMRLGIRIMQQDPETVSENMARAEAVQNAKKPNKPNKPNNTYEDDEDDEDDEDYEGEKGETVVILDGVAVQSGDEDEDYKHALKVWLKLRGANNFDKDSAQNQERVRRSDRRGVPPLRVVPDFGASNRPVSEKRQW